MYNFKPSQHDPLNYFRLFLISFQGAKPHKLLKRKPPAYKPNTQMKNKPLNKDRSRAQSSSTETARTGKTSAGDSVEITTSPPIRTNKRSAPAAEDYNGEDSLVRELNAVKHRGS